MSAENNPTANAQPEAFSEASLLRAALWYAEQRLPVFPVHSVRDGHCSCGKKNCQHPGKHPRTKNGFKDATTDREQINRWWTEWPDANIGMPTGETSGLLAVDIDPRNWGSESWESLVLKHGPVPDTAEQITGGGGRHIVFRDPGVRGPNELAPGIDIKSAGGYILVAPSAHASGRHYIWDGIAGEQSLLSPAAVPDWLLERFAAVLNDQSRARTKSKTETNAATNQNKKLRAGQRNTGLTSLAGTMRRRGMSQAAIEAALLAENRQRCNPPLSDAEVREIAASIARYPASVDLQNEGTAAFSSPFRSKSDGMFRVITKGEQVLETKLTNYTASIKTSILLDDGLETKREFEVEAQLMGRQHCFVVPASQFAGMDWPIQHMGPTAITFPNQKDYARTAIQSLSLTAEERYIYTHTGWRKLDGRWLFLHSGGAIGEGGSTSAVNVRLTGSLAHYELQLPADSDVLRQAVQASLRLVDLAPSSISFPMRAASCRAVLGDADFSAHLVGETGAFKSELAALEQQHFGARMNRLNLPGAWSSTGNALEVLSFHAKDTLIVIDDFAPQGSAMDISRYHATADRVFRAAGNRAGRSRLDSTAKMREPKPPRGLILSTGEDIPRGHSVRARLLILELSKGDIDATKLTLCQKDAAAGLYAQAMGAYVRWLAGKHEEFRSTLADRVSELRLKAMRSSAHARTPEIIANLQVGFEFYLEFAHECGAITAAERGELANHCWEALFETAAAQTKHHSAVEPTVRFLELLRACLVSGRAHLANRAGYEPARSPESCGWRRDDNGKWAPHGDCIGWTHDSDLYLEPVAAYRAAQSMGREGGEPLAVSEQTLKKRLREKGLLASVDQKRETLTVRRNIAGSTKSVLHLLRSTLLPEEPDKPDISDKEREAAPTENENVGFSCRENGSRDCRPDMNSSKEIIELDDDRRECRVSSRENGRQEKLFTNRVNLTPAMAGHSENLTGKPDNPLPARERFEI